MGKILFILVLAFVVIVGLGLIFYHWFEREEIVVSTDGTIVTLSDFESTHLGNKRTITVFLPPGYEQGNERYPVLYLNDGQDIGQFRLEEQLNQLYQDGGIEKMIVVAIPTNEHRLQEYGTAGYLNAQGLGSKAGEYAQFVVAELVPEINGRFRTKAEPENQGFLGVSLGGLSAFDIVWNHPDQFGFVGVMSGSFWWRAPEERAQANGLEPDLLIMHQIVARDERALKLEAWFEAGSLDELSDRDQNGVIDAIQDTVELIEALEQVGHQLGEELVYVEVEGGTHNYETWSEQLPIFLRWASERGVK